LEILDLLARYSHAADGLDPVAYADCFTEDGTFHGRVGMADERKISGRENLIAWVGRSMQNRGAVQNRHIQTTTTFGQMSETHAVTRTLRLVMRSEGENPPVPGLTSVYRDELVQTPQGWRIKLRQALPDRKGILHRDRVTQTGGPA